MVYFFSRKRLRPRESLFHRGNQVKVKSLLYLLLLLQVACSPQIDVAKEALEAQLSTNRADIEYGEVGKFAGGVVCGEFSEFDPNEGRTDFKYFLYRAGRAYERPGDDDLAIFCSDDPAAQLYSRLGIGPYVRENASLHKVHTDLGKLQSALEAFRQANKRVPGNLRGLDELTDQESPHGPFIDTIPLDPWDQPYVYDSNVLGFGTAGGYKLYTLGADGSVGGTGEKADISVDHLKYLDHIAGL
jgi:type II secretion system protein G